MEQPIPVKEVGYFFYRTREEGNLILLNGFLNYNFLGIKLFSIYNYNDLPFLYEKSKKSGRFARYYVN